MVGHLLIFHSSIETDVVFKPRGVVAAPDFSRLAVDDSVLSAGAVLFKEDDDGIDHPVSYFSKKSTVTD